MMRNDISFLCAAPAPEFLAGPAQNFHHPSEVLGDSSLTAEERRAILADWASDAHAVEDSPWLRQLENGARVPVSAILDALGRLDGWAPAEKPRSSHGGLRLGGRHAPRLLRERSRKFI